MAALLENRNRFRAFLVARLGSEAEADDLLQDSLVRALRQADELRDETKLVPWFFRLLRHTLIDHVRARQSTARREQAWSEQSAGDGRGSEEERQVCACLAGILPALKPVPGELLRRVEFDGESVAGAAAALGLTANHASVLLHRARRELRTRLEAFCGDCTARACLDCDCGD